MNRAVSACLFTALLAVAPAFAADAPEAARRLAQDVLIVDTHIDAPTELLARWADLGTHAPDREFDWPRADRGGARPD